MQAELKQVAKELRERFATGDANPKADLVAQHAADVAHALTRWADRIDAEISKASHCQETLCREMAHALTGCLSLIEDLTPGVRHLALQDYAKVNTVPIAAQEALAKFRSVTGEETPDPITAHYEDRNRSGQASLTAQPWAQTRSDFKEVMSGIRCPVFWAIFAKPEPTVRLMKKSYSISAETLQVVLAALGNNHAVQLPDGDSDNNDDIIEAERILTLEIEPQNET